LPDAVPDRDPSSLDALLALPDRGPAGLDDILRIAAQGNWQMRAWSLSAAGRIARAESPLRGVLAFGARRLPALKRRFPAAGYRGRYVRNHIANGLVDRSWPVRVAAALALGECRSASKVPELRRLLTAPYRAERIAAASAIVRCGGSLDQPRSSLLHNALPAPVQIGDHTRALDFLAALADRHADVLAAWPTLSELEQPPGHGGRDWAEFLAGAPLAVARASSDAEIERYDADGDAEYLLTKPFSHINRSQNARLLHTFGVVAEQLRVPREGRILDLGGGSGWVSELLARLGYRPITLDISTALLEIGTRRFARTGLTPRFAVGDMTALPVASGSMDAVVVIDALHHVPDVPAVFREAFRVLAAGGQFVVAEPGEGHGETTKSRGEMLEHGVQEREIHVFEAVEYGRAAGFDDIGVVPHYVPGITMTSDQVRRAMASPADDWMIRHDGRDGYLAPFVIQSMFDHPVLVFSKGQRPIDSTAPRELKAELTARFVRDGVRVRGVVIARNVGDTIWSGGSDFVGRVQVGVQLLDAGRRLLNKEFHRTGLTGDVTPGRQIEIPVDLTLPDPTAAYVLKIDLVDEGICWFEDVGSMPIYVPV
jgi:SAM-dependent methyltransferase